MMSNASHIDCIVTIHRISGKWAILVGLNLARNNYIITDDL